MFFGFFYGVRDKDFLFLKDAYGCFFVEDIDWLFVVGFHLK